MNRLGMSLAAGAAAAILCVGEAFATDIEWKSDASGNADGLFNDAAHWNVGREPGVGDSAYLGYNFKKTFTVTFPDGDYDFKGQKFAPNVYSGNVITFVGTNTVFRMPKRTDEGTYVASPVDFCTYNYPASECDMFRLYSGAADPTPRTSAVAEFSNFLFTLSSASAREMSVSFLKGTYNFLNPCGNDWAGALPGEPTLFLFANNNSVTPMDSETVAFGAETSLLAPRLDLSGNAFTNTLLFAGGTHSAAMLTVNYDGNTTANPATATETDLVVSNGAVLTVSGDTYLNWNKRSADRTARLTATGGGKLCVRNIKPQFGVMQFIADGGEIDFGRASSQDFLSWPTYKRADLIVRNGGKMVCDQYNNGNDRGVYLGCNGADPSVGVGTLTVTDGGLFEVKEGGKFSMKNGSVEMDGATVLNADTLSFDGGKNRAMPVDIRNSTVTNSNGATLTFGGVGPVPTTISNSTVAVASGTLTLGRGVKDLYDCDIRTTTNDGYLKIAPSDCHYDKSTVNLHSGTIEVAKGYRFNMGETGLADLNISGGKMKVGLFIWANGYSTDAEGTVRLTGGELEVWPENGLFNGKGTAFQAGGHSSRHVRLVLDGGRLVSYSTGPALKADGVTPCGATACLEANGGTLTTKFASGSFLYGFKEAKVGPKGLTIDNNGKDITVEQGFADKDDANGEGRIILKGGATTKLTGDLSGVSCLVADEGTVDLTKLSADTLGGLVATNAATLKLDPAKTVEILGDAAFANVRLAMSATLEKNVEYAILRIDGDLPAASRAALEEATVTEGLPAGTLAEITVADDGNGDWIVKVSAGEPRTTKLTIGPGEGRTIADDVPFHSYDTYETDIAAGETLTLSGRVGDGSFVKDGDGLLVLADGLNRFIPGFSLLGGGVRVADFAALGLRKGLTIARGALTVTGLAEGARYDGPATLTAADTNDIVVVNNVVDVTMTLPSGNHKGEFVKRGAGTLTFEVEGTKKFTGGPGWCKLSNDNWAWNINDINQLVFDPLTGLPDPDVNGIVPLLVLEGELQIVGRGAGAKVTVNGECCVGTTSKEGSAQPGLVLDNVTLEQTYWPGQWFHLGAGVNSQSGETRKFSGDFATEPYLTIRNGANLITRCLETARFGGGTTWLKPSVTVDGATLTVGDYVTLSSKRSFSVQDGLTPTTIRIENGSAFYCKKVNLGRDSTVTVDNSVMARKTDTGIGFTAIGTEYDDTNDIAVFNFTNAAKFYCNSVQYARTDLTKYHPLTFNFDDAEWIASLDGDYTFAWDDPAQVAVNASGEGLKLPVPADATWTLDHPVGGSGAVVSSGAGTLKLGPRYAHKDGPTVSAASVPVDLGGNSLALFAAGPGSFANGTIAGGGIRLEVSDEYVVGETPVLDGVAFSGRVKVDLGRTAKNPIPEPFQSFAVCTYTGAAPDVSTWRLVGTGRANCGGTFVAKDGVVTATPGYRGMTVLVR